VFVMIEVPLYSIAYRSMTKPGSRNPKILDARISSRNKTFSFKIDAVLSLDLEPKRAYPPLSKALQASDSGTASVVLQSKIRAPTRTWREPSNERESLLNV